MALSSIQLEAFMELAKTLNFSRAATNLLITQSALSQRIKNLEERLGSSLFVREAQGARLTDSGSKLLRYCRVKEGLEGDFVSQVDGKTRRSLSGVFRIGGYASIMRSVVFPALSELTRKNPDIQVECFVGSMRELPRWLSQGEIEFAVLDHKMARDTLEHQPLGYESNVLVESAHYAYRKDVYLDHRPEDPTAELFLRRQGERFAAIRRTFRDDVYGIIDGVALGWGRAVVPLHLVSQNKNIHLVKGHKSLKTPVILHHMKQPYYSRLHQAVVKELKERSPKLLQNHDD